MRLIALAGLLLVAAPAHAEVVGSTANGFHLRHSVAVAAAPDAAFDSFADIAGWWTPAHSYSGKASRLSLQAKAGGCFCEKLDGGGVEHMRVAFVDQPRRLVMTGGLGPLLYEAVAAVMDIKVEATPGGSKVTMDYKAAGFASGGADKLAPAVDRVLGEQMQRFAAFASRRPVP